MSNVGGGEGGLCGGGRGGFGGSWGGGGVVGRWGGGGGGVGGVGGGQLDLYGGPERVEWVRESKGQGDERQ